MRLTAITRIGVTASWVSPSKDLIEQEKTYIGTSSPLFILL